MLDVKVAEQVVANFLNEKYARLLVSMSLQEAKQTLGFPPNATPSPEEISKAYKVKALENHPDRGGDAAKMVEINVAKDILDGKGKAKLERGPSPSPETRSPRPKQEIEDTLKGQTFDAAWGDSGVPAGTEWKFISIPEWAWPDHNHPGHRVWVLYGQTDKKHIFLAFKERGESAGGLWINGKFTKIEEDWQSSMIDVPVEQNISKIAAKYIKLVGVNWVESLKLKAPNKFVAWPGGDGKPTKQIIEKIPRSGGASLKDILVGTGLLSDEDPAVAGRKSVIELFTKYDKERRERAKADGKKVITTVDQYAFFIRINGKTEQLTDDTVHKMGKIIIPAVFEWNFSEGPAKNLTRLRGGRYFKPGAADAIKAMADCLTGEPSWVHIAMQKAVEEYEDPIKKAMRDPLLAAVAASAADTEKLIESAYFHTSNGGLTLNLYEASHGDSLSYRFEYDVNTFGLNGKGGFSLNSTEVVDWLANALLRTRPLLSEELTQHSWNPISQTYVNVENGVTLRVASEYLRQIGSQNLLGA